MTFDTRPPGPADLVPSALRAAIGERAGVDCSTTNTFGANLGNLGEYGIADRIGEETCQALLRAKAVST
jgi:methionine synthase I (cobalamin-dependent)